MKKHPIFSVLVICGLILGVGCSVAYYNTKTFGFDEDAVIFSQQDDGFTLFDYKVYYDDVNDFYEKTQRYLPDKAYATDPKLNDCIRKLPIYNVINI